MAGDWIKMRTSLLTNPKVNGIAKELEEDSRATKALSKGYGGVMSEIVTRNVMRYVTVASLMVVWGSANEHTKDGVFKNSDLYDIDDMVGIPGFGEAMACVGWAVYDEEENTVTLPNFNEYNTSGEQRSATAKSSAQRQKDYRDRQKSQIRDVTNNVTSNRREEKRREEINTSESFERFWSVWPASSRKTSKGMCLKSWKKASADLICDLVIAHVEKQKASREWTKNEGEFIPAPLVYLNQKRWEGAEVAQSTNQWAGAV